MKRLVPRQGARLIAMDHADKCWDCLCSCGSYEHQIHFNWFEDEREMYLTVHLADRPFWRRLKDGIAYILGHKSMFGEFDEICLSRKHANALREVAGKLDTMDA